ncbi:N,N-dimethylformamidase beta subunit family domain-containing protein [Agrobacterium tumefaciens]|uniref:N,N-dimethylformamidase beta subunit family domain-containing protein n=1 Tax=Agrobacterium tumefaciens TaxID=358 RepID=UPI003013333E
MKPFMETIRNAPPPPRGDFKMWLYSDQLSYSPGEPVFITVNTNAPLYSIEIRRDDRVPTTVVRRDDLPGAFRLTPDDCSTTGCGWPVSLVVDDTAEWRSGAYVVTAFVLDAEVIVAKSEHVFIVRPQTVNLPAADRPNKLLLIAATATWTAYNDWGGSNHYQGYCGPNHDQFSPRLSIHPPYARGFVSIPDSAPRAVLLDAPDILEEPVYPHMEWAYSNGYSKKYVSAGWSSFERKFVHWAQQQGYEVDIISQTDLHEHPGLLSNYRCAVMVGHDEYWSWEMRDAIDAYVAGGGKVARFADNFMWQIRLEDNGDTQVCYKYTARDQDPFMLSGPRHLVTESWDAREIHRPGADTFGLNATRMYASWSGCSPRGTKGFSLYRPDHWSCEGTGLYYGDIIGGISGVFGYEVDGIGYEIRGGLPYVADGQSAPDGMEILALGLSSTIEEGSTIRPGQSFLGTEDAEYVASVLMGATDAAAIEKTKRGCGAIVSFRRGKGEVYHAGSSDWIMGLARQDKIVERITNNVLRRFLSA